MQLIGFGLMFSIRVLEILQHLFVYPKSRQQPVTQISSSIYDFLDSAGLELGFRQGAPFLTDQARGQSGISAGEIERSKKSYV